MARTQGVEFRRMIGDYMESLDNGLNVRDHLKNKTVPELVDLQKEEQLPFDVMLFNLTGDMNTGSMVRTATVSGAQNIWVFGRRKFDRRGLVGCNNYVNLHRVNGFVGDTLEFDVDALDNIIQENNLIPIWAEMDGLTLGKFHWPSRVLPILNSGRKPVIIMGNENSGFPDYIVNYFKTLEYGFCVTIPQRGVMRSFNVGHALSAILWDMRKDMGWF